MDSTASPALTAARPPIDYDIPCALCDYDLRGLSPLSKCPECGFDVSRSIERLRGITVPSDAVWLRDMRSANLLMLLTLAVALALGFVTQFTPAGRENQVTASGTAMLWAVSLWAVWRITRREPLEARLWVPRVVAVLVRASAAVYIVSATLTIWLGSFSRASMRAEPAANVAIGAAIVAGASLYLRERQIARRLGAHGLGGEALMLAILSPALTWQRSDALFSYSPVTGWGMTSSLFYSLMHGPWRWTDLLELLSWPVLLSICQIALVVQMLVVISRALRRSAMPKAD